jgi:hypothetical protein
MSSRKGKIIIKFEQPLFVVINVFLPFGGYFVNKTIQIVKIKMKNCRVFFKNPICA